MRYLVACLLCLPIFTACESDSTLRQGDISLQRFDSCAQLEKAVALDPYPHFGDQTLEGDPVPLASADSSGESGSSLLGETNIQVEGVDELDRAKAAGDFIYQLNENELLVLRRSPAETAGVIQRVDLSQGNYPVSYPEVYYGYSGNGGLYVTNSRVVVISSEWQGIMLHLFARAEDGTLTLLKRRHVEGRLQGSRMIENQIHLFTTKQIQARRNDSEGSWGVSGGEPTPVFMQTEVAPVEEQLPRSQFEENDEAICACTDVYYEPAIFKIDPEEDVFVSPPNNLVCALSVDMDQFQQKPKGECVASSGSSTIYASLSHAFLASSNWSGETPIHQFALSRGGEKTKYVGSALVHGDLLNQFSMDEHEGHLRVASTIHNYTNDPEVGAKANTINEVSVFELVIGDPELVGKIEGLAAGERIYSVRFLGDRGYVVTFKKVDPLFALDLTDPKDPQVRGELKIPGYSSYLHPMAEGYLLAIGKDAEAASESADFAWYQGMAMSIFDVRDLAAPKLLHKIGIGSRGTESEALHDHKAFRYIPEEDLVLFPINLYENSQGGNDYGEYVYSGFQIYQASLENGFGLVGESLFPDGDNVYGWYNSQGRSFYKDGMLSMVGGGELVLRSANAPEVDVKRVALQ